MNTNPVPIQYYLYQPVLLIPYGAVTPPGGVIIPPPGSMFPLSYNVANVASSSFNQNNNLISPPLTQSITHLTNLTPENTTDQIPELEKELEELRRNDLISDFQNELSEHSLPPQHSGSLPDSLFPPEAPVIDLTTEDQGQADTPYHQNCFTETVSIPPEVINLTDQECDSVRDLDDGMGSKENPLYVLEKELDRLKEHDEPVDQNFYNFIADHSFSKTTNQAVEIKESAIPEPERKRRRKNPDIQYDQPNSHDTFRLQTDESDIPQHRSFSEASREEKTSKKRKERKSIEKQSSWNDILKTEFVEKSLDWNSRDISTLCYAAPLFNYDWNFISADLFAGLFSPEECEAKYKAASANQPY